MGMKEGILPHQQSIEDDSIEDERRLTYVAITRARENLAITMTKHRKKLGKNKFRFQVGLLMSYQKQIYIGLVQKKSVRKVVRKIQNKISQH